MKMAYSVRKTETILRDCAIIIGKGVWTTRGGGGIGKNHDEREGGLDVKFYAFGGGITFFTPFHKLEKG